MASNRDPPGFIVDLTDIVDAVTPDSFSTGILDRSGNGLPTAFFDMFLQNGITDAATQTTHASDPNRPPPGSPDTPINLVAPAVKTVNPACDFDVTSRVATHEGPVRPTGVRNRYIQQVLITNTSAETITGEISPALDGLPRDVDVRRPNRVTTRAIPTGSPFVEAKTDRLRPTQSAVVRLKSLNPKGQPITCTPHVLVSSEHERGDKDDQ